VVRMAFLAFLDCQAFAVVRRMLLEAFLLNLLVMA
jgi:hypothetical protein